MDSHQPLIALGNWLRAFGLAVASLVVIAAVCPAGDSQPSEIPPARFLTALDLEGTAHRLGDGEECRGAALVFMSSECPISREFVPELNRLAASAKEQGLKFYGILFEPGLKREAAVKFQQDFKVEFPLLFDASGEVASVLQPTHVPEAFVLNTASQVVYRGRIDNRYGDLGKKRPEPTTRDLADAIAAVASGNAVAEAKTKPIGCPVEAPQPGDEDEIEVTYNRDIAPILLAQCVECHRPGEVAPFSLLTYEDAAKRASFLAEVTESRLMPPWKAEIGHGRFLGERRLTDRQIAMLKHWAANKTPEGDPADKPPIPKFASGWRLGEPDLELVAPDKFTVKADGEDTFQHWIIPIDIPEDKEVVGFEFRPGNPAVVHHAILFLDNSGRGREKDAETPEPGYTTFGSIGIPTSGILGVWTPGMTPRFYPQNAGMKVRKGTDMVLQLHMHPSGKEETDQSRVALYFADKPIERAMSRGPFVVGSILIDIPAGKPDHEIRSSVTIPADVTLISLLPHMHLIGKEMKLTATLPGGEEKSLLWIKDWNFYWQDNYVYHEPLKLPAGTKLDIYCKYDNSADNPLNPRTPPERVFFGNGSGDEMCFGIFQIIVDNPSQEGRMQGALITTLLRDWNEAKLDDVAKQHILEEAGKLFGGGRRFQTLLSPRGSRGEAGGGGQ